MLPAGGEMSGLTAHFLFGVNFSRKTAADFARELLEIKELTTVIGT
jgi:hypothetical protein